MHQLVEQTVALIIPNGQKLGLRREIHAPYIVQWSLGRGPVGKDGRSRDMQKLHAVLVAPTRHCQDLAVMIEFRVIGRCVQVHDGFDGSPVASPTIGIQVHHATFGADCQVFEGS